MRETVLAGADAYEGVSFLRLQLWTSATAVDVFETALSHRVEQMLDACTRCGKCFEVCPITGPAGVAGADPAATIAGVLDIVRFRNSTEFSQKWANACVASGECIKACDYGVNPRFLLTMARVSMARAKNHAE